ncbi:hypothetical protein TNCV_2126961 [Trichonephila clavipes]|nr:hypothetical protein TNCV_2126961 [Trichonephila clavipes]
MENGMKILIVALYISPNQKLDDIINFFTIHCCRTQEEVPLNDDEIPMILSADFNVNFASGKSLKLVEFLKNKLNLSMKNSPQTSTIGLQKLQPSAKLTLTLIFLNRFTRRSRMKEW